MPQIKQNKFLKITQLTTIPEYVISMNIEDGIMCYEVARNKKITEEEREIIYNKYNSLIEKSEETKTFKEALVFVDDLLTNKRRYFISNI